MFLGTATGGWQYESVKISCRDFHVSVLAVMTAVRQLISL